MSYQEAYAEFLRTNPNAKDPAIAFYAGWKAASGPAQKRRNDEHDPRIWED